MIYAQTINTAPLLQYIIPEHSAKVGIQILSGDTNRLVEPWYSIAPVAIVAGPKAKRKKRHTSKEISLLSPEFRGRLKMTVVTPSTCEAEAAVKS